MVQLPRGGTPDSRGGALGGGPRIQSARTVPFSLQYPARSPWLRVSGDSPLYLIPILSIAIQAGLIVHVIKTGRNTLWIWAIALLPAIGPIAYLVAEILPELFGGRTARRAKSGVQRIID